MEPDRKYALELELPIPPSIDSQYVNRSSQGMRGRMLTDKAAGWKRTAGWLTRQAVLRTGFVMQAPFVGMDATFYFHTLLLRDRDNGLKILQDAVCEALHIPDRRVMTGHVTKRVAAAGREPYALVGIWEIWEWEGVRKVRSRSKRHPQ